MRQMEHDKNKRQAPSRRERHLTYDVALIGAAMIVLMFGWPLVTMWAWATGH